MADGKNINYPMSDFKRIIVPEAEIAQIISRLAHQITADYSGKKLLLCGILKGAFIFMADLCRQIDLPAELTFINASSYGTSSTSAGVVKIEKNEKIEEFSPLSRYFGYEILIIDDILDTGNTFLTIGKFFKNKGFASIEFCALLDKPERRESEVSVKYIGKQIENEFVVGYGLDYNEKYRGLPYIAALDEKIFNQENNSY
ncbi:MAG: hypoxanthine phosphoribosyltransferase [Oscillospiraceae bacterium]|nr:hypoxanthine phosphoribosyltransferase [Oscillospiraceae bacterium]